ncbi:MAG: serine/threonine protein kinase [Labilithrix sp.]|nr:serine/threonine protein kinase [Labilithrix sp.]
MSFRAAKGENTRRSRVGDVIDGKWRIEGMLHRGLTATVYGAVHLRNARRVALKILRLDQPVFREKFQREGSLANAVGHPGVVKILDDGVTEDGERFMVLELLSGSSLERRAERAARLPIEDVVRWGCELLDVLGAAHARGIVHRDVRAAHVQVTGDGSVRLLDFGAAARGFDDPRSDVWAVGAMLYTLLSGRTVPRWEMHDACHFAPPERARSLRDVAPDVPRAICGVIDRALAFDKNDRWRDASSMREALRFASFAAAGEADTERAIPIATSRADDDRQTLPSTPVALAGRRRRISKVVAVTVALGAALAVLLSMDPYSRERIARAASHASHAIAAR